MSNGTLKPVKRVFMLVLKAEGEELMRLRPECASDPPSVHRLREELMFSSVFTSVLFILILIIIIISALRSQTQF